MSADRNELQVGLSAGPLFSICAFDKNITQRSAQLPRYTFMWAFAKSYFTEENGNVFSFSCTFAHRDNRRYFNVRIVGTTNAIQVHWFDYRIGEVDSINKSLNVRCVQSTMAAKSFCAYLNPMFPRWKFGRRFHDAINFIIF